MFTALNRALADSRARRLEGEKGFTLIELLVVVLIIGILSAIAIPIFLGQQNEAKEAATKSDLVNLRTALISVRVANDGEYPAWVTEDDVALTPDDLERLQNAGYVLSENTYGVGILEATDDGLCLVGASTTGAWFVLTEDSGAKKLAGVTTMPTTAVC